MRILRRLLWHPRFFTAGAVLYVLVWGFHAAPFVLATGWRVESLARTMRHAVMSVGKRVSTAEASMFSIAVVWPASQTPSYPEGVTLAWEELNAAKGPLAGRIKLRRFYEESPDETALGRLFRPTHAGETLIANQVVSYGDVKAVLGHRVEETVIPSSLVYEDKGMLFFSAASVPDRLTGHNLHLLFRMAPLNRQYSAAQAEYIQASGFKYVISLTQEGAQFEELEDFVSHELEKRRIPFPQRLYYSRTTDRMSALTGGGAGSLVPDYRLLISKFILTPYDGIALYGDIELGTLMLKDIESMGNTKAIFGTDTMGRRALASLAGSSAKNLLITRFVPDDSEAGVTSAFEAFVARFEKRFGAPPSADASKGYFAFQVFAAAAQVSPGLQPLSIATTLRLGEFHSLFGTIKFDAAGNVKGGRLRTVPYRSVDVADGSLSVHDR